MTSTMTEFPSKGGSQFTSEQAIALTALAGAGYPVPFPGFKGQDYSQTDLDQALQPHRRTFLTSVLAALVAGNSTRYVFTANVPNSIVNNDTLVLPLNNGNILNTVVLEFQVDGDFSPTPGAYTVDTRGLNAHQLANAVANVLYNVVTNALGFQYWAEYYPIEDNSPTQSYLTMLSVNGFDINNTEAVSGTVLAHNFSAQNMGEGGTPLKELIGFVDKLNTLASLIYLPTEVVMPDGDTSLVLDNPMPPKGRIIVTDITADRVLTLLPMSNPLSNPVAGDGWYSISYGCNLLITKPLAHTLTIHDGWGSGGNPDTVLQAGFGPAIVPIIGTHAGWYVEGITTGGNL